MQFKMLKSTDLNNAITEASTSIAQEISTLMADLTNLDRFWRKVLKF